VLFDIFRDHGTAPFLPVPLHTWHGSESRRFR
jgi:hypothetical protein